MSTQMMPSAVGPVPAVGGVAVPKPDALFLHSRPCPPEWQRALQEVCPRYEGVSWWRIVWEPGEDVQPDLAVQRWVIWQMRTREETQRLILRDYPGCTGLREEHPRKDARWDATLRCFVKADGRLAKTDKLTWELYHETGCYGARFWVIQGDRGGHRFHLSHIEKQVLKFGSGGKLKDVPRMGDLPYAPFDSRVLPYFAHIEAVAVARKIYKYGSTHAAQLDRDERDEMERARLMLFDYLGEQFGAIYDEFRPFIKQQLRAIPHAVGAKPQHTDKDEVQHRFVTDT